jgi:hypothetical protein
MLLSRVIKTFAALLCVALLLPGCTGMRLIDNQVESFAPQKLSQGTPYRFERLPSQQAQADTQKQLEELAQKALSKAGLQLSDTATLTVQLGFEQRQVAGSEPPLLGWGFGMRGGHGFHHRTLFSGLGDAPLYWRQVSLVMRNAQGQVVFESRATQEGVWSDSSNILAAMLDATLQGFPSPPSGPRRVDIEIPR